MVGVALRRAISLCGLTIALSLVGCSSLNSIDDTNTIASEHDNTSIERPAQAAADAAAQLPSRPLDSDSLLSLIVGELAVHHRDIDTAAASYIEQARITRDPGIAARASQLARYQRNVELSYEMAKLWYETAPTDEQALANYADILARLDQPLEAIDILAEQIQLGQDANFGVLRHSKFKSSEDVTAQALKKLAALNAQNHSNFSLLLSYTLLLQQNQQHEAALAQLRQLKKFDTEPVDLAVLESRLLNQLARHQDAADILEEALGAFPDERKLKVNYGKTLTYIDKQRAEVVYQELLDDSPRDTQVLVAHSLVAADNKHFDAAKRSLNTLTQSQSERDFAHLQLGLIAKEQGNSELALSHFKAVKPSNYFLSATQNIINSYIDLKQINQAREYVALLRGQFPLQAPVFWVLESKILLDQQDIKGAHEVLNRAIEAFPEQIMLRIERSNISELLDNFPLIEEDLRFVLEREPNNVIALNALGYTLTVRTTRYFEALDLIKKAIAINPESAAIRDSLGWVQFKLNQLEDAEKNLRIAFEQEQEDEIAAHLIELYWVSDQKRKAKKIYKRIHTLESEHPIVDKTMKRLGIRF